MDFFLADELVLNVLASKVEKNSFSNSKNAFFLSLFLPQFSICSLVVPAFACIQLII